MNRRPIDERVILAASAAVGNHYLSINEPLPFQPSILFKEPTRLHALVQGTAYPHNDEELDALYAFAVQLDMAHAVARLAAILPEGGEPGMQRTRRIHMRAYCDMARSKRGQFVNTIRAVLRAMTNRNASQDEVALVEFSMAGMLEKALVDRAMEAAAPVEQVEVHE